MSSLTIKEIETLFRLIINKLKTDKIDVINFEMDDYWIISSNAWDVSSPAGDYGVGSLEEDISYLKEAIKEKVIYSYSNLDRMATVLRMISEVQAPIE